MPQCQFIYRRHWGSYSSGDQCREAVVSSVTTLCTRHHASSQPNHGSGTDATAAGSLPNADNSSTRIDNSFPRTLTDAELRECVNLARERASPEHFKMHVCVVCGRLQVSTGIRSVQFPERGSHRLCHVGPGSCSGDSIPGSPDSGGDEYKDRRRALPFRFSTSQT